MDSVRLRRSQLELDDAVSRSPATSAPATPFDKAVTKFAFTYADQNDDRDYAAFIAVIDNGQIETADG